VRDDIVSRIKARRYEVLPRSAHTSVRAELRASQRGRLICAIADVVSTHGYAGTSVADVCAQAGVSRKSFYEHFSDKEACFLAAYDSGAESIYEAMLESLDGLEDWPAILDAVLATWLEVLDADIAFTRAFMIEFWAAGEPARERWKARRDRTEGLLKALHEAAAVADLSVVAVSDTLVAAVVGGVNRVVISHVIGGNPAPLISLKPELSRFIQMVLTTHEEPSTPPADAHGQHGR
jgi:AcrR family transcriptional regulator